MKTATPSVCDFFTGIENIPSKNFGGCLFFCYVFWKWLKKHGLPTESFDIVQYDWIGDDGNTAHNLEWIAGEIDEPPVSSHHFAWLYEGIEYDSDGIIPFGKMADRQRTVLSGLNGSTVNLVDIFCFDALTKSCWNWCFDREAAIGVVASELEIDMSDTLDADNDY